MVYNSSRRFHRPSTHKLQIYIYMDILTFRLTAVKRDNQTSEKYIRANIMVLSNHGFDTTNIPAEFISDLQERKIVLYTVSDGRLLLYRTSLPTQKYIITRHRHGNRFQTTTRSKPFADYLKKITNNGVSINTMYAKVQRINVATLELLPINTNIDLAVIGNLPLGKWALKHLPGTDLTLVGRYPGEKKNKMSEKVARETVMKLLDRLTKVLNDGTEYFTEEHIENLVELRLASNPVLNEDKAKGRSTEQD
mgnify:CR=1 FL=1